MAAPRLLKIKVTLAWLSLLWERFYASFWPALCVAGAFAGFAWIGLFILAGRIGHIALLTVFAAAFLRTAFLGYKNFRLPDKDEAARRLEQDSGLKHRPLRSLDDTPAKIGAAAPAFWEQHRKWLAAKLRRLRPGAPRPEIARRDQRALRVAVVLLLVVSGVTSQNRWLARLEQALSPSLSHEQGASLSAALEIWITPPAYTRLAPVFPLQQKNATIRVPANSMLEAHVSGGFRKPVIKTAQGVEKFSRAGGNSFVIKKEISQSGPVSIRQGFGGIGSWNFETIPDNTPIVAFTGPTETTANGSLKFSIHAKDDYGIEALTAQIRLEDDTEETEPFSFDLAAAQPGTADVSAKITKDLTDHPWAGRPVLMTLTAADALGQTGTSETTRLTLPERIFKNPLAAEIANARKMLFQDSELTRPEVIGVLENLLNQPERLGNTLVVPLALRAAASRLRYDGSETARNTTAAVLWDLALLIEDGSAALAERKFEDALDKLMEAVNNGETSDEELMALTEKMRDALGEYLLEAFKDIYAKMQPGQKMPELPPDMAERLLNSDELGRFLEHLKHLIKNGRMDEAQKMLSDLRESMNGIDLKNAGQMTQQQIQMMESLKRLRALIEAQQKLIDKTFQLLPETPQRPQSYGEIILQLGDEETLENWPPQPQDLPEADKAPAPVEEAKPLAWEQNAVRVELGEITRSIAENLPEIPKQMVSADQNMGQAENKLRLAAPDAAMPFEQQALKDLQELFQNQSQQLMQQMAGGLGLMPLPEGFQNGDTDPLGRRRRGKGWLDQSGVKIPDEAESKKAHEILEELRQRSNEARRSKPELEYIDRLLQQF